MAAHGVAGDGEAGAGATGRRGGGAYYGGQRLALGADGGFEEALTRTWRRPFASFPLGPLPLLAEQQQQQQQQQGPVGGAAASNDSSLYTDSLGGNNSILPSSTAAYVPGVLMSSDDLDRSRGELQWGADGWFSDKTDNIGTRTAAARAPWMQASQGLASAFGHVDGSIGGRASSPVRGRTTPVGRSNSTPLLRPLSVPLWI